MGIFTEHNPITHRVDIVKALWAEAIANDKHKIFRWLVKEDELRLIEAWFRLEGTEHGDYPDLFIRFDTEFDSYENYSNNLVKELIELYKVDHEECASEGIDFEFKPVSFTNEYAGNKIPAFFSDNLERYIASIPDYEGGIVVWLTPNNIFQVKKEFEKWLVDFSTSSTFKNIKLMLVDSFSYPLFENLKFIFPENVVVLSPDLKMDEAMKQVAASGNPSDPDVQFRKYFVNMSQAVAKNDLDLMETWAEKALKVADTTGWAHLKVTVFFTTGSAYLSKSKFGESRQRFNQALQIATAAFEKGDTDIAPSLIIQSQAFLGTTSIHQKDFENAALHYEKMAHVAFENKDYFNTMEGYRMVAYCLQQNNRLRDAWNYNWKAIESARNLDEQVRQNSTLGFVGKSMFQIASKAAITPDELEHAAVALEELAGHDWETKVNQSLRS